MLRLDPFRLPYAETHFKFKLPWSPLYRRWPEVFLDGPSFCVPGVKPVFFLAVKDADYFPITVQEVEILLQGQQGETRKQTFALSSPIRDNLRFIPLDIDFSGMAGVVSLNARITVEKESGKSATFLNANFPGPAVPSLKIQFLSASLPYPDGWFAGEMHCHSEYSNDPVEFGAPLPVLREAGRALGLGFVLCTDHSYDFYYNKTRYMEATDPQANFQAYRDEALTLNGAADNPEYPVLIPGEEVSCGNHLGENVHLLVAGHEQFLPGLGDGGRRWFNNKPDLTVGETLERLGGTPCFAAHPRVKVGALEKKMFRRGMWHEADLRYRHGAGQNNQRSINGLQFWNGHRGKDFQEGRDFWISQLLAGKRLSPIGANDAHGDLNRNTGVKTPLFSLYHAHNHVFGHVRTVVHAESKSIPAIQAGMRDGRLFCTDGPFLNLVREGNSVRVSAGSIVDFGGMEKIMVFQGKAGESKESLAQEWSWENGSLDFNESVEWPEGAIYLRAEARTTGKRLAISAPVYGSISDFLAGRG